MGRSIVLRGKQKGGTAESLLPSKVLTEQTPQRDSKKTVTSAAKSKSDRRYSPSTLGLLWGLSGNRCAFPGCPNHLIAEATEADEAKIVGHIAHIYASSDDGPRGRKDLKPKDRDSYENLLLLCRHHHGVVDAQANTYTAADLQDWKRKHYENQRQLLAKIASGALVEVTYPELEIVTQLVLTFRGSVPARSEAIPPDDKIALNRLSHETRALLMLGAAKTPEVSHFIAHNNILDSSFGGRLRAAFVQEYRALKKAKLPPDDIFRGLMFLASGRSFSEARKIAGLYVLTHFFITCDVFARA